MGRRVPDRVTQKFSGGVALLLPDGASLLELALRDPNVDRRLGFLDVGILRISF